MYITPSKSIKGNKFIQTASLTSYFKWKRLINPLIYRDEQLGNITVPSGFVTDGASIPRICWGIIGITPYSPRITDSAVLHDWLYAAKTVSRKQADLIFKEAMVSQGLIGKFRIALIYRAVRSFGWINYKKCKIRFTHNLKGS